MGPILRPHVNNLYTWIEAVKKQAIQNDLDCKQVLTPGYVPPPKHKKQIKREKVLREWVQKYAQKPDKLEYLR